MEAYKHYFRWKRVDENVAALMVGMGPVSILLILILGSTIFNQNHALPTYQGLAFTLLAVVGGFLPLTLLGCFRAFVVEQKIHQWKMLSSVTISQQSRK